MRRPLAKAVAAAGAVILLSYAGGVGPGVTESCSSTNTSCWDAMAKVYRKCTVKTCTTKEGQVTTDVRIERTAPTEPVKNKLGTVAPPPPGLVEQTGPGAAPTATGGGRAGSKVIKDTAPASVAPAMQVK
jgi:hypothetical protein